VHRHDATVEAPPPGSTPVSSAEIGSTGRVIVVALRRQVVVLGWKF
jgi:hypothetical protein